MDFNTHSKECQYTQVIKSSQDLKTVLGLQTVRSKSKILVFLILIVF